MCDNAILKCKFGLFADNHNHALRGGNLPTYLHAIYGLQLIDTRGRYLDFRSVGKSVECVWTVLSQDPQILKIQSGHVQ